MNSTNTPDLLVMHSSKIKMIFFSIISFFFILIGIWMVKSDESIGWLAIIFFGIGLIVFVGNLLPNASSLTLTKDGFEVKTLFKKSFTKWNEVEDFQAGFIVNQKSVLFNYTAEHKKYNTTKKIAYALVGGEGALPDTYGKSTEELAKIMNEWKNKYSVNNNI